MGKNRDLIQILLIILIGMFIPFLGSITLIYGFDLVMIAKTFGYFLLIFAGELLVVYLFFTLGGKKAKKNMEKFKPK
jgi:hypothetical protein